MSIATKVEVVRDTATPEMRFLQGAVSAHRMAAEIGPRGTRLIQRNFRRLGPNVKGWPSTHFWGRAAEATNWQEGFGFVMLSVNQIGVRQRLMGGTIKPVNAGALTIPATAEAYGKSAREFSNLEFGFALDPETGHMRPCLKEKKGITKGTGTSKGSATTTGLKVFYWLSKGVKQDPNAAVMPSDEEFGSMMDESVEALLKHPETTK